VNFIQLKRVYDAANTTSRNVESWIVSSSSIQLQELLEPQLELQLTALEVIGQLHNFLWYCIYYDLKQWQTNNSGMFIVAITLRNPDRKGFC